AEPALHLLNACKLLRAERDKERDLISQKEQEADTISDLQNSLQRVERELHTLERKSIGLTPQILIQHLTEEVTVQSIIVKEKLPFELNAKKNRMKALSMAKEYSYLGPDKIAAMRNDLDTILKDIQNLKIENSLEELQLGLKEKQDYSKTLQETLAPKAEELKKYVNRLKTKSAVYKRCKMEIAGLKAENGALLRTAVILDGQITNSYPMETVSKVIIPENYATDNALATNTQLSQTILALGTNLAPLIKEIKVLRQTARETNERYQKACKSHNTVETSMKNTTSDLLSETQRIKENLIKNTEEKKQLQERIARMKITEERLRSEAKTKSDLNNVGKKLKQALQDDIVSGEETAKHLNKERERMKQYTAQYEIQTQQWNNII
ncbi:Intraflagellar transport protein 81-like protein, partial [Ooceraea biroi]